MNFLNQIVSEKVTHALGWTVLHAMWQVSLLALIMAIVLWFLKNKSAKIRYTVGCATLFLMLGISQVTFLYQFLNYQPIEPINTTAEVNQEMPIPNESFILMLSSESNWTEKIVTYLNDNIQMIVAFWVLGFILFAIRLFGGLKYISKIRKTAEYTIDPKWDLIVQNLAKRFPIKKGVQLAESAMVQVPMILGFFKPLILFPIGTLNNLDPKEVEAILAHELGHVFRNDYLVNILQSIVDVFFYFHPAAWWVSSQIRIERENCCDDLAIEVTNCSLTYAKALVSIKESSMSAPMMAMTIMKDDKKLLNRIKRILNQPTQNTHAMEKLITSCLLLLLIFGLTISASLPVEKVIHHENDDIISKELKPLPTKLDTIAPLKDRTIRVFKGEKNKSVVHKKTNDQHIKITLEDDEITKLVIDGKKIDKSEFDQHQDVIDDVMENLPPLPPSPPAIGMVPPNSPKKSNDKLYIYQKGNNGEDIKISIDGVGDVKTLKLNGEEIPHDEYGEEVIITHGIFIDDETADGKKIQISIDENGDITRLELDGEEISEDDYELYEDEVDEIINNIPTPPVPPAPPAPPAPPTPPNSGGGLSFDDDVQLKKDHLTGKIIIEVDPNDLDKSFDIAVKDNEVFLNGEKVEDSDYSNSGLNKFRELMELTTPDANIEELEPFFAQLEDKNTQWIFPKGFQTDSFDFDVYVDKNKYPKSLKKIHNEFNREIQKLKKEGRFPRDLEKISRNYSKKLERELESLKLKSKAYLDAQKFSLQKIGDKVKWMSVQSNMDEQLFQTKLANELLRDGLIDSVRDFKFQLKKDQMRVNGKKYKGALFEKYSRLYYDTKGSKINGKFTYFLRNNGAL